MRFKEFTHNILKESGEEDAQLVRAWVLDNGLFRNVSSPQRTFNSLLISMSGSPIYSIYGHNSVQILKERGSAPNVYLSDWDDPWLVGQAVALWAWNFGKEEYSTSYAGPDDSERSVYIEDFAREFLLPKDSLLHAIDVYSMHELIEVFGVNAQIVYVRLHEMDLVE